MNTTHNKAKNVHYEQKPATHLCETVTWHKIIER